MRQQVRLERLQVVQNERLDFRLDALVLRSLLGGVREVRERVQELSELLDLHVGPVLPDVEDH